MNLLVTALFMSGLLLIYLPLHAAEVTSHFGWRKHPVTGNMKFHSGIDIAYDSGIPIKAVMPGRVVFSGWYGGYGRTVILDHGEGNHTLYAHCSRLNCRYGQVVTKRETIAFVGSSGISTGPHLHLEWWRAGKYMNPLELLHREGIKLD